jgi:hypothetical protein
MLISFDRTMAFLAVKCGRYSTHLQVVASGGVTGSSAEVEQVIALSIGERCVPE